MENDMTITVEARLGWHLRDLATIEAALGIDPEEESFWSVLLLAHRLLGISYVSDALACANAGYVRRWREVLETFMKTSWADGWKRASLAAPLRREEIPDPLKEQAEVLEPQTAPVPLSSLRWSRDVSNQLYLASMHVLTSARAPERLDAMDLLVQLVTYLEVNLGDIVPQGDSTERLNALDIKKADAELRDARKLFKSGYGNSLEINEVFAPLEQWHFPAFISLSLEAFVKEDLARLEALLPATKELKRLEPPAPKREPRDEELLSQLPEGLQQWLREENLLGVKIVHLDASALEDEDFPEHLFTPPHSANEEETSQHRGEASAGLPQLIIPEEIVNLTVNLTSLARQGKLDPLIGRKKELDDIAFALSCRRRRRALILGEPGGGKTALIEGFVQSLADGTAPKSLCHYVVLGLRIERIVGTRFKGGIAENIGMLINWLRKQTHVMLVIDNVHTIVDGSEDASLEQLNGLENLLSLPNVPIILSTDHKSWRRRLAERFDKRVQRIELSSLNLEEATKVLHGLKGRYEAFHNVVYADGVIEEVVKFSKRFILEMGLPESAIDVIDQMAAATRLNYEKSLNAQGQEAAAVLEAQAEQNAASAAPAMRSTSHSAQEGVSVTQVVPEQTAPGSAPLTVDCSLLAATVARFARIPLEQVKVDDHNSVRTLEADIRAVVFGQDQAIESVVNAIKLSRSGLITGERPMGSFLFTGPTGVGKTEVARQLAKCLSVPLLRFDMSEYSESHTVSRLIGSPAGYVGYGEGGLLTEQVNKHPYCVVLLDEIEKAHPALFNLLLQVMDYGRLTDSQGRESDFRNVILIMTSNVGAREGERQSIGFSSGVVLGDNTEALKRAFSPEFRNRLDRIVTFAPLNAESLRRVVDKFLGELTAQLLPRGVSPRYSDALKGYLISHGYVPNMGARPMRRLIDEKIRRELADELLFGELKEGGEVDIDYDAQAERVRFTFRSASHA